MMTAHFEEALLKVLHEIADNIEVLSYDLQNLTSVTHEIAETLSKQEEQAID